MRSVLLGLFVAACSSSSLAPPSLQPGELVSVTALSAIRSDGALLYYIDDANAAATGQPPALRLMRVRVNGGAPTVVLSLPSPSADTVGALEPFELDTTTAYVPIGGHILKVALDGSAVTTLVDEGDSCSIGPLALDTTSVYYLSGCGLGSTGRIFQTLKRVLKAGGQTIAVPTLSYGATHIATDGTNVYWPSASKSGFQTPNDQIMSVSTSGGSPNVVAAGQHNTMAVAMEATSLYWLNSGSGPADGQLLTCDVTVTCAERVLNANLPLVPVNASNAPTTIANDQGAVLWNDFAGIHAAANGTSTDYHSEQVSFFTADAANVYWFAGDGIFQKPR